MSLNLNRRRTTLRAFSFDSLCRLVGLSEPAPHLGSRPPLGTCTAQDECNASDEGPHRPPRRLRNASGRLPRAPLRLRAIQRCGTGGATAPAPRPPASPGERAGSPREGSTAPRFIDFPNDGIDWFPGNNFRKKPPAGRETVDHLSPTGHPRVTTGAPK